ncbi:MAG TPA: hypothetical protein P5044_06195 [bacterium]|nr:hypothetical protein [bacterium]
MIKINKILPVVMAAILIMASCKKEQNGTDNDLEDMDYSDTDLADADVSDNDKDVLNFSDMDSEQDVSDEEYDFETEQDDDDTDDDDNYVEKFCEPIEVVSGGDKNCPVSADPGGSYEFGLYSQNREGNDIDAVLTIEKVITYDLRPEKDHFGVAVQGLCKGTGYKNGEGTCEVYINRSVISMFDTEALIGREWNVYYKSGFYGSIHAEIQGREIIVVRDKSGWLVGVSAMGIVDESGEASGDKGVWPTDKVTEFKVEQFVPDDCAVSYCRKADYYDWESIDVLIAPPLKFTRNEKSITVRNYESLEMDDYVYTVRNSERVHEKDPDQMLRDTGKKYQFDFYVFNKKALK